MAVSAGSARWLTDASPVSVLELGERPFLEVRDIEQDLLEQRVNNQCGDTLLVCEHPPTLSIGRRTNEADLKLSADEWRKLGVEVVLADRGGGATFHGPGQLVIYPVISLRARRMGVRDFVGLGLSAIASALKLLGVKAASARLEPAGVWVPGSVEHSKLVEAQKIASVGLRMKRGVTSHGFSINLSCDLSVFNLFTVCGVEGLKVTSLAAEIGRGEQNFEYARQTVVEQFVEAFS